MTTLDVQINQCATPEAQRLITGIGRQILEAEISFRELAGLCERCGLHTKMQDRMLCKYCTESERTKMLDKRLTKLDRMWAQCRTAA